MASRRMSVSRRVAIAVITLPLGLTAFFAGARSVGEGGDAGLTAPVITRSPSPAPTISEQDVADHLARAVAALVASEPDGEAGAAQVYELLSELEDAGCAGAVHMEALVSRRSIRAASTEAAASLPAGESLGISVRRFEDVWDPPTSEGARLVFIAAAVSCA